MKLKHVFLTVFVVLLLDQVLKIYIKTQFFYGQEENIIGTWFKLHFIENEGMAFGMKFGDHWGQTISYLVQTCRRLLGFLFYTNNTYQAKIL